MIKNNKFFINLLLIILGVLFLVGVGIAKSKFMGEGSKKVESSELSIKAIQITPTVPKTMKMEPTWSHDGRKIAYILREDTDRNGILETGKDRDTLWIMNVDGTEEICLTPKPNDIMSYRLPKWSPDDTKILCAQTSWHRFDPGRCVVIDVNTKKMEVLGGDPYDEYEPIWAPGEGHTIIFEKHSKIREMEQVRRALAFPVSQKFYFTADGIPLKEGEIPVITGEKKLPKIDLWIKNPDGTNKLIMENTGCGLIWSPDKKMAIFGGSGEVWLINSDGSGLRKIENVPKIWRELSWSTDSKKLLFIGMIGEGSDIFIVRIEDIDKEKRQVESTKSSLTKEESEVPKVKKIKREE
ncbi:MAG: hypothetical protein AB1422_01970 [bacterium]